VGGEEIPIDTFDGLLRDLLAWDLVVPGEGDDAQTWHLVARAQQQLGVLAIGRGPWPAERTAYVGRQCADCRGRRLTWLREGSYVCDPCLQKRLACTKDEPTSIAASPTPRRTRWALHHRQKIA
jgi:hypothetical protein